MTDKVFRDPLYNYICIDKKQDGWLIDLLNCPEVQRLRRIHQLGVSNITYPGADHNRLAHSLGVTHLMQLALNHLQQATYAAKVNAARMALLASALLHDVGHGPFSHLFEPCLGIDHEQWSVAIVLDESTKVNRVLRKQGAYLPRHVADLIEKGNTTHDPWQRALLSSELDVDRLDYLRRDSLFTGAGYGHFDWFRILTSADFLEDQIDLIWPEKSALAIEEYIFARYYMYQNVYLHKTTRGFEQLLQSMWRRADQLRESGADLLAVPGLRELWRVKNPNPKTFPIQSYLGIEEFTVLAQIHEWRSHPDGTLKDLACRFLDRDGLAMIEAPQPIDPLEPDFSKWEAALEDAIKLKGFDNPKAYCLRDTLKSKYRRPYRPESEPDNQTAVNSIRLRVAGEAQPVEISKYLPRLGALTTSPGDKDRYYIPKNVREDAERIRANWKW